MTRPSETVTAVASSVLAAVLIIGGAFMDLSKVTPEVFGATVLLIGWLGTLVTYFVAKKQRAGTATSAADGKVG
jgi:hypothetical protein